MSDQEKEKGEGDSNQRKGWDELILTAFEKIAATPGRLKDSKETFSSAFDWMKGIREEIQNRIKEEISARIGKLDWDQLADKVGDHLAKNYRLEVKATVDWAHKDGEESIKTKDVKIKVQKKDQPMG